jgi:hypothetical protein
MAPLNNIPYSHITGTGSSVTARWAVRHVDYTGRDMKTSRKGMKVSEKDWSIFLQRMLGLL